MSPLSPSPSASPLPVPLHLTLSSAAPLTTHLSSTSSLSAIDPWRHLDRILQLVRRSRCSSYTLKANNHCPAPNANRNHCGTSRLTAIAAADTFAPLLPPRSGTIPPPSFLIGLLLVRILICVMVIVAIAIHKMSTINGNDFGLFKNRINGELVT